ncbi:protein extra-macrochaetae [Culicoides brevitarsis]|uniref:protein extra-macrochaetae n=1 Tax=Culicoides brevitarsis TaxID=469753 RepID=UPI00307B5701
MKALTVCPNSTNGVANGRVSKNRDGENAEIQLYISKLKELVPFMPKNRKISKLEVIQHVIEYIVDLQSALDSETDIASFDAAAALAGENMLGEQQMMIQTPASPRQPLAPMRSSPNLIVSQSPATTVQHSSNNNNNNNEYPSSPSNTISEKSS